MPQEPPGPEPKQQRIVWQEAWRIVASRFPPIHLFERVSANPAVWDALIALEEAVNPRIRDEVGEIRLVPPSRRVSGPNASWVMAPFTHLNPNGSRFSDGSYGVYYAARRLETAIRETAYHFERFARQSSDPPRKEDMRVLVGTIDNDFDEVDSLPNPQRSNILDPSSYAASQPFGKHRRGIGSNGISYPSVRHLGGRCIGAFWPDVVTIPIQERHLEYEWDGNAVTRYFDFKLETWVKMA